SAGGMAERRLTATDQGSGYRYDHEGHSCAHDYLLPVVRTELATFFTTGIDRRIFDLGCGNGSVAAALTCDGFEVCGVDPSIEGIGQAEAAHPTLSLRLGSAYDDLAGWYGSFPAVISLEVVEHLYAPREFARTLFQLVDPGGIALVSTPYHGYWKNLAL